MELSKNIFFNTDKLVENQTVKVSYTGKFFQDNSNEVYLHYGFGIYWENVSEVKMERTDLGFQAEISLGSFETLNFCFKNENDVWDNNDGANYIFPIEKVAIEPVTEELALVVSSPRRLRKSYILSKKIKLAIYKIITFLPKIISGNYRRKLSTNEEDDV